MKVCVLGKGMVGEKVIELLENHPLFEVAEVATRETREIKSSYVISCVPAAVAHTLEPELAKRGHRIFTNASAHRMSSPLIIPEINGDTLSPDARIIANPNCTTSIIALALHPLLALGPIKHVSLVTMQAISGAGKHFHLENNLIPYIPEEEEKIVRETRKILDIDFPMTVHCHRVPVPHGHTVALHVEFEQEVATPEFTGPYVVYSDSYHPQPTDLTPDDMRIHIGRLKHEGNRVGFVALGHNLVRGAAGAAIANMEAFHAHFS